MNICPVPFYGPVPSGARYRNTPVGRGLTISHGICLFLESLTKALGNTQPKCDVTKLAGA